MNMRIHLTMHSVHTEDDANRIKAKFGKPDEEYIAMPDNILMLQYNGVSQYDPPRLFDWALDNEELASILGVYVER